MSAADMRDMGDIPPIVAEWEALSAFERRLIRLSTIARKAREAGVEITAASVDRDGDQSRTVVNVRSVALADTLAGVALRDPVRDLSTTFRGTRIVTHRERDGQDSVEITGIDVAHYTETSCADEERAELESIRAEGVA